jgi:hypothetical protein
MLPSDGRALGLLADAADRGTIDDHGETEDEHVEELTATLGGRYGRLLVPATHVVTHANGTLVAAALFTRRDELPFLAFCLTPRTRRGAVSPRASSHAARRSSPPRATARSTSRSARATAPLRSTSGSAFRECRYRDPHPIRRHHSPEQATTIPPLPS